MDSRLKVHTRSDQASLGTKRSSIGCSIVLDITDIIGGGLFLKSFNRCALASRSWAWISSAYCRVWRKRIGVDPVVKWLGVEGGSEGKS